LDDNSIIDKAYTADYVLVTNDKDFGELVFRMGKQHIGIVLLRLDDERSVNRIAVLEHVLELYSDKLINNFIIVTEETVRIVE